MNRDGIRLLILRATGEGKEIAQVEFKAGLNLVAHESDTGKTYILECINFLMGGKTRPRPIPESTGYDTLWLEVEDPVGSKYVVMREIVGDGYRLYRVPLDDVTATSPYEALAKSASAKSGGSLLIAKLAGFPAARLKSNERNDTGQFSFRTISHLVLVEEIPMVQKFSPVFSGSGYAKTFEKSAFKFVLTGEDDSKLAAAVRLSAEQSKELLKREVMSVLVEELLKEDPQTSPELSDGDIQAIEEKISKQLDDVEAVSKAIRSRESERRVAWNRLQEEESKLIVLDELIARFSLLRTHYESDLRRLEFISEGHHFLDQLDVIPCPLCGAMLPDHLHHPYDRAIQTDVKTMQSAYAAEARKISIHLIDLQSTAETVAVERVDRALTARSLRGAVQSAEIEIAQRLEPRLALGREQLDVYVRQRAYILSRQLIRSRLQGISNEADGIEEAITAKNEAPDSDTPVPVDRDAVQDLCDMMRELLRSWRFLPDESAVEFVEASFDFRVDGQLRADRGKGVRALIHAAFNIALMRFCHLKKLPHPGFVMLDSPLTTYKGKNRTALANDDVEEIRGEVQIAFFEDLANASQREQIIVLENKPPPASVVESIRYIEFVGANGPGRGGFFPVSSKGPSS